MMNALRSTNVTRILLLVLAMVLVSMSTLTAAQATAQTEDSYEFKSGQTLSWSGNWAFDDELTFIDGDLESVSLTKSVSVLSVLSLPNDFNIDEARDIYLESFLEAAGDYFTIDRGSYGDVSYSLDVVTIEGFKFGAFTLFRAGSGNTPTFAYVFLSEASVFGAQFSDAQASFALDGAGLFDGVDGKGLQDQLVANAGNGDGGDDDVTPESGEEDVTPEADETPADSNRGDKLRGGREDDSDPTEPADDETETDVPSGTGLVEDGYYVSPQFLAELTWEDTYTVDTEREVHVSSDEANGVDFLALTSTGDAPALLTVQFLAAVDVTPSQLVEIWQSADFLADTSISADAEVVLADSSAVIGGVVVRDFLEDGTEIMTYREVHLLEDQGAIAVFTFNSLPATAETAIADSQSGMELNGEPVLDFFTSEEMLADF